MKASELRINNLAIDRFFAGGTVKTVCSEWLREIDLNNAIAEPIPLTEEWLVKFGFRGNERQRVKRFVGLELYTKDVWRYNTHGNNALVIMYVHQLQNLYFALIGEELTILDT